MRISPAKSGAEATNTITMPSPSGGEELSIHLNLAEDLEFLREFHGESVELLQDIEQGILVLEDNPADAATINSIFRAFHTFKGGAGFLHLESAPRRSRMSWNRSSRPCGAQSCGSLRISSI